MSAPPSIVGVGLGLLGLAVAAVVVMTAVMAARMAIRDWRNGERIEALVSGCFAVGFTGLLLVLIGLVVSVAT